MATKKDMKIELHCHLDGSLPLHTVRELIDMQRHLFRPNELEIFSGPSGNKMLKSALTAPKGCKSLEEYLRCFSLPIKLLQTPEAMKIAGRGLVEELSRQGVGYAEIRYAPQLHSEYANHNENYLYEEMMLEALLEGINSAQFGHNTHTHVNLILCMMRNLPDGGDGIVKNIRTLFLAKKFLGKGVVAVDLAGAEARDATSEFEKFFRVASEQEIPFTIHAGESGDDKWRVESIERAIAFGAKRIGHGVGLIKSKELRKIVKDADITVECCPKSNLDTMAVAGIEEHPIKMLLQEGIRVTINTDNMTVSDTTLDNEYELVKTGLGLTNNDIRLMQLFAIEGAFTSNNEKKKLMKKAGF